MKKLVLCAAVAALAGATAASATQPVYSKHANFDASLARKAPSTSSNSLSRPQRISAAQAPKARKELQPQIKMASQPTLRNESDSHLGVDTFVWSSARAQATPLTPLKSGQRLETGARSFLSLNSAKLGLSKAALENARLIEQHDTHGGPKIARFQQTQDGIDVFGRQISVMMDRNMKPVAASGYFAPQKGDGGSHGIAKRRAASFDLSVAQAVSKAFSNLGGSVSAGSLQTLGQKGAYTLLRAPTTKTPGKLALNGSPRGKQVLYPLGDELVPAWYVELATASPKERGSFSYGYVVSAATGEVLFRKNLTEYEAFTYRTWADSTGENRPYDSPLGSDFPTTPLTTLDPNFDPPRTPVPSTLVTIDHGPISTGDPWLTAGATETVGNNVDAYIDLVGQPGEDPNFDTGGLDEDLGDYRATVTAPGLFDYSYQAGDSPITDSARRNAIVNLFYMNNWLHDYWYDAGFDEVAGNAQASNYGRGGVEGDPILAQAQDWGGRNNANMSTPADGESPTMQMYLFDGAVTLGLNVTSPALGEFDVGTASFGPTNFSFTGSLTTTTPANGCTTLTNGAAVAGKIALIDRGACSFQLKTLNAEAAGAIGVIIANNTTGEAPGLGSDNTLANPTIGTISVSQADGSTLKTAISGGTVVASASIPTESDYDGTVDNGIVAHEFFHYVSNRLVNDGFGLVNQQGRGMGEGWSDVAALLLTVHEGDDAIAGNENFGGAYSTAAYSTGSAYFGIRRAPYSVNPDVFPMTFQHIENGVALPTGVPLAFGADGADNSEVHNAGEIWANTLWTFYVALLNDSRYTFAEAQDRFKKYIIAGLKMTPFAPTFLEARDGILAAALATDQADFELAANAFAKMGMGVGAVAPYRLDTDNAGVVESYVALAASFEVTDYSIDITTDNDEDGIFDAGETAQVTVAIHSNGTRDLSDAVTANLSATGNLTTPATVTFPAVDANGNSSVSFPVTLTSATLAQTVSLTLSFPQVGASNDAVVEPDAVTASLSVNYDVQPQAFDSDDVENPLASEYDWGVQLLSGHPDVGNWGIADGDSFFGSGLGWYIPDNELASDAVLVSPPIKVGSAAFTFSFDHYYQFEYAGSLSDGTPVSYDGGVLEVSQDGGQTWADVTAAGGSFTEGGYNGLVLALDEENGGREGFADYSQDFFSTSTVSFGTSLAGKTVRFRFRAASDILTGEFGWFIDNFRFTGNANPPFGEVVENGTANYPVEVVVPANFSAPERAAGSLTQATITLAGGAEDRNGLAGVTYAWTQTAGPAVTLSGANTATARFTAPNIAVDTSLTFSLTVSDGQFSDTGSVTVTVTNVNSPATISISGPPRLGVGNEIVLNATASDVDGALTYRWSQVSGPEPLSIGGATGTTASATTSRAGIYVFRLTVTDPEGGQTSSDFTVDVFQPIKKGGSFDWMLILAGLAAFGARRRITRH